MLPNETSTIRLTVAVLFEQNDDWQTQNRYTQVEVFARIDGEEVDPILSITANAT